jgi:hypothetical protein
MLAEVQEPGSAGSEAGGGRGLGPMIPSGEIRWLVVCGILLLPLTRAAALELEVGARFPAEPTEKIVVKNDGGVSNATDSFAFGEVKGMVCRAQNCWRSGVGPVRVHPGRFWSIMPEWYRDQYAVG